MVTLNFNPATDIADLNGKVIFITGGTGGIGAEAIVQLAKHNPSHIYFTGRSTAGAEKTLARVKAINPNPKLTFIQLDQGSLKTVKQAITEEFKHDRLDLLICNAGIMNQPPALTEDGYELQFGTNHMGHALIIKLLLPTLLRTAEEPSNDVRIILLTSQGAAFARNGIEFDRLKTDMSAGFMAGWIRYGQAKLANILTALALSRLYPQITSVSIHPGVVTTELVTQKQGLAGKAFIYGLTFWKMLTPEQGAYNTCWVATTEKGKLESGGYYEPVGVKTKPGVSRGTDEGLAKELWEWSLKELEAY